MSSKYNNIQSLIQLWADFEKQESNINIRAFGKWLLEQHESTDNVKTKKENQDITITQESKPETLIQISHMARFLEFYTKKFFEGLTLNNLIEFNFLHSINKNPSLNKTDIINLHFIEYTTGIDILNRLSRLQLIEAHEDINDRRSKKIRITPTGKRALLESLIRLNKIHDLILKQTDVTKWQSFVEILNQTNTIQQEIYRKYNNQSYLELIELKDFTTNLKKD